MFRWALIFAGIALFTSLLGLSGLASISKDLAIILFIVAIILVVISFLTRPNP